MILHKQLENLPLISKRDNEPGCSRDDMPCAREVLSKKTPPDKLVSRRQKKRMRKKAAILLTTMAEGDGTSQVNPDLAPIVPDEESQVPQGVVGPPLSDDEGEVNDVDNDAGDSSSGEEDLDDEEEDGPEADSWEASSLADLVQEDIDQKKARGEEVLMAGAALVGVVTLESMANWNLPDDPKSARPLTVSFATPTAAISTCLSDPMTGVCPVTVSISPECGGTKSDWQPPGESRKECWSRIISTTPEPCDPLSLAAEWSRILRVYGKRGKLKPFGRLPTAVCVAQTDHHRAFQSLTAGAKVKCRDGSWATTKVIVDTGAGVTLIRQSTWDKMDRDTPTLAVPPGMNLIDASGNELKMAGIVNFTMRLEGQEVEVAAILVPDLGPALLLGMDFLTKAGASIDIPTMTLKLKGHRAIAVTCVPLDTDRMLGAMVLPAYHATTVYLRAPEGSQEEDEVWVEAQTIQVGVYLARTISRVAEGRILGQMANTTGKEVTVEPRSLPIQVSMIMTKEPVKWPEARILSVATERNAEKPLDDDYLWKGLSHLPADQQRAMYNRLQPYRSMFITNPDTLPGAANDVMVRIRGGDGDPKAQQPYRNPVWKRDIINHQVDALLRQGMIEETLSPWAAPVVLVEKPSSPGQWRLCIDYRLMNKVTEPVRWPLPRMDDTIAQLGDYKYFTTIDLAWGFWACKVDPRDQEKTSFVTEDGQYKWTRMPMGWQGAPATFQKATDLLLRGMKGETVLAYIDDLIIFTRTFPDHVQQVAEVCKRLHAAGRAVKVAKVHWAHEEVNFLGYRVGKGLVTPISSKVRKVLDIKEPHDDAALQHFLGCVGVYRKFLPDLSSLVAPMYKIGIVKGSVDNKPFAERWSKSCRLSFQRVRIALENMAGLELPKGGYDQAIQLEGDRSGFGGALLQRRSSEYPWKPLEFFSGTYREADRKRSGPERIVMATSYILNRVRPYINPGKEIRIFTDEPGLQWALDPHMVTGRALKAALTAGTFSLIWGKAPGKYKRFGGLFTYNSPELAARLQKAEQVKVEAQQRGVQLDSWDSCGLTSISQAWVVSFDGGHRAKAGIGGYGWLVGQVINDNWTLVRAEGEYTENVTTVNIEEFRGITRALEFLATLEAQPVLAFGDSKLVVGALQGKMKCRMTHMNEALQKALAAAAKVVGKIQYFQVSRDFNTASDFMANVAMDERRKVVVTDSTSVVGRILQKEHHESLHERLYTKPTLVATQEQVQICVVTRAQAKLRRTHCDEQGRVLPWKRLRHGQLATPWMKAYVEFLEDQVPVPESDQGELDVQHFEMRNSVLWLVSARADEEWRVVIPHDQREDLLSEHHEGKCAGHLRGPRFLQQVRSRYYWPKLSASVKHYEDSCAACQLAKGKVNKQNVPLSVISEITTRPFQCVAVDAVVNLPLSLAGNRHIVVLIDLFTRYLVTVAVPDLSVDTYARAVLSTLIADHGCPDRLISDQGGQFTGQLAQLIYELMRTRKNNTTAYHPQANGLCERVNGTLVAGLKAMATSHPEDWDVEMKWFTLAYRTTIHRVTQCTPFELVHGRNCRLPYDVMMREFNEPGLAPSRREYLRRMKVSIGENRARVRELTEKAREQNRRHCEKKFKYRQYAVGEQVYLYYPVVPEGVAKKLWVPWRGPFRINKQLSDTVYELELPEGSKIKGKVSANRLAPMVDRMSWPDTPTSDLQTELSLEVPGNSQALVHEDIGKTSVIRKIVDERVVTSQAGRRGREFLAECREASGRQSQRWIPELKLSAGDLLYQYRQAKQAREQKTLLEGSNVWDHVDSDQVAAVDRVDLRDTTACGVSEMKPSRSVRLRGMSVLKEDDYGASGKKKVSWSESSTWWAPDGSVSQSPLGGNVGKNSIEALGEQSRVTERKVAAVYKV